MKALPLVTKLSPLALAISLTLTSVSSYADDKKSKTDVESIVIVGQTTNTVITPEELDKYQANDLADIFRSVPSVSVGGSLGIAQKVYIRGMEDTLLNVTVDGAPQTGTLFHHIGRVSIDPELLKEVEVQAGAGEATSGAGAIGGSIRFKTKDVDDLLNSGENFGGTLKAGYFSNDGYKTSGTFYGKLSDDWGVLGSYIYTDRDNMEDGDGNELYGTAAEQSLGFIKVNGQISENQQIAISYEKRDEEGDFGARPNWPTLENDTLFAIEGERETLVANHQWNASKYVNLETSVYHTQSNIEQDRFDRWGLYGGKMKSYGFDIRNTSELGHHTLTYGVEYRNDEVSSEYLADDAVWQVWASDPTVGKFKEEGDVTSLYLQDHWQVTNDLLISMGLRFDQYDLEQVTYNNKTDSSGTSPNIGLQYTFNENWEFTAGYAQAIRGKEVGDSFTLEAADSIDPELDAEKVENSEIGLTYHDQNWRVTASVYQSEIKDVILDQLGRGIYYENVGNLKTDGFELKAAYNFESLNVIASYSNNDAELNGDTVEGYEHIGLANERGNSWGLNLNYTLSENVELGWNFTHVESLDNIEVLQRAVSIGWIDETQFIDKDGYSIHDIYVKWEPLNSDILTINLSVQNLFDEHYRDHSSVGDYNNISGWEGVAGLYETGRDVRLSVSYKF